MAAESSSVALRDGRKCTVTRVGMEVKIDAKATFRAANKAQYRALINRFASADEIECRTADGIPFLLRT